MKKNSRFLIIILMSLVLMLPGVCLTACGGKTDPSTPPPADPNSITSFHGLYSSKKGLLESIYAQNNQSLLSSIVGDASEETPPSTDDGQEDNQEDANEEEGNPTDPETEQEDVFDGLDSQPEDDYSEPGPIFSYYCREDAADIVTKYYIDSEDVYSCVTYNDQLVCVEFDCDLNMQQLNDVREAFKESYIYYCVAQAGRPEFFDAGYFGGQDLLYFVRNFAFIKTIPLSEILRDDIVEEENCFIAQKSHTLVKVKEPEREHFVAGEEDDRTGGDFTLPDCIVNIASNAVKLSYYYDRLILPDSVRVIENKAIDAKDVVLNEGLEYIGDNGIEVSISSSPKIPSTVKYVGYGLFSTTQKYKSLASDGVIVWDNWCLGFKTENPTDIVNFPAGVVGIANKSLPWDGISKIYIPASVNYICYDFTETLSGNVGLFFEGDGIKDDWPENFLQPHGMSEVRHKLHPYFNYTQEDETKFDDVLANGGRAVCKDMEEYREYGWEHNTKTLYIGADIQFLGYSGGFYFTEVEEIVVDENNPSFCSVDGVMYTKDMKTLICVPSARKKPYTIPEGVTGIYCYALNNLYDLKTIFIPKSVQWIGRGAFYFWQTDSAIYFESSRPISGLISNGGLDSCFAKTYLGVSREEYQAIIDAQNGNA